jgi:hypothetical protein
MNRHPQTVLAALVLGLASTGALATDLFRIEAEAAKSLPTQERAWTVAVDPKLDLAGSDHLNAEPARPCADPRRAPRPPRA